MLNSNTTNPEELLDNEEILEIETDDVPEEIVGTFSDEFEQQEEEQVNYADDGKDSDEETTTFVAPVARTKKTKMRKGEFEETVKRIPLKGQTYRAKHFSIEIVGKKGKVAVCKVIQATENSNYTIGEEFEAEEVAFYSDYYSLFY